MLKQLSYLSFHAIPSLVNLSNHPSMFTERCWDMGSSPWRPCCGYGYSVTWTFPSPGWPQVVENSLGTVITFPGAPDGFSGMGYISILGALRHPCVCHSGFGHLSSPPHSSWWRTAFACCLGLMTPVQQLILNLNPPCRPWEGPQSLHALLGTPNPLHDLQGTAAPMYLRRDLNLSYTPFKWPQSPVQLGRDPKNP